MIPVGTLTTRPRGGHHIHHAGLVSPVIITTSSTSHSDATRIAQASDATIVSNVVCRTHWSEVVLHALAKRSSTATPDGLANTIAARSGPHSMARALVRNLATRLGHKRCHARWSTTMQHVYGQRICQISWPKASLRALVCSWLCVW